MLRGHTGGSFKRTREGSSTVGLGGTGFFSLARVTGGVGSGSGRVWMVGSGLESSSMELLRQTRVDRCLERAEEVCTSPSSSDQSENYQRKQSSIPEAQAWPCYGQYHLGRSIRYQSAKSKKNHKRNSTKRFPSCEYNSFSVFGSDSSTISSLTDKSF
jgi:hypothetical protein